MSAQIVVLAQWKADHASIEIRFKPLLAYCAWLDWVTGSRKAAPGVVCELVARS